MPVTDVSELRKKREAQNTRNFIIKVFLTLLLCGAVIIAVATREMWLPYAKSVVGSIPENVAGDGNAELAEGRFPIKVEGGMGYQLCDMSGSLALLDDSQFHVYSADGKVMFEKQHAYANPVLCVNGDHALVYDEGGKTFSLEGRYKTVYDKNADDVIYLAKLSRSNYAAVVTRSDKFLAQLKVYNKDGKDIFTYFSYDSRIIDVTFTDNSSGCIITVLSAEDGMLRSKMIRYDFKEQEARWESESIPTLALDVRYTDDGIMMTGDTMMAGFTIDGQLVSTYTYDEPIYDYDVSGNITAVITENTYVRRAELIALNGNDCSAPTVTVTGESAGKLFCDGREIYIMNGNKVDVYNSEGLRTGCITLEDEYEGICKIGKHVYLLGYDSINRIDYTD